MALWKTLHNCKTTGHHNCFTRQCQCKCVRRCGTFRHCRLIFLPSKCANHLTGIIMLWPAQVRFVIVLRDPIARDLSSYNHQRHSKLSWNLGKTPHHTQVEWRGVHSCGVTKSVTHQGVRPMKFILIMSTALARLSNGGGWQNPT